jgi:NADH-quinone oxidoreductase subunit N
MDTPKDDSPITAGQAMRTLLGVNAFAVLLIGILPGAGLMGLCLSAIQKSL